MGTAPPSVPNRGPSGAAHGSPIPFLPHQAALFEATKDVESYGLFWEPGVGKTKPTLETAAHLAKEGKISALLVVTPNNAQFVWAVDQYEAHFPKQNFHFEPRTFVYQSKAAGTKWHDKLCDEILKYPGFILVAMSYDALVTERGKRFAKKVLTQRPCLYVLDESHKIKTPKAVRTRTIIQSGKFAKYKRILTGTPVTQSPFDVYSQVRFLDPEFWGKYGVGDYFAFKQYFGIWRQGFAGNHEYPQLVGFKNLDELQQILTHISHRLTKEEAGLNLPPKLYSTRYYEMAPQVRDAYQKLRDEYTLELQDGTRIDAELSIVRLLRLQQIVCGYVQHDAEEPIRLIQPVNQRLLCLMEILEELPHKAIIWCRFTHDIDQILRLPLLDRRAVRWDGKVDPKVAEMHVKEFQDPTSPVKFFVANSAKSEALTLTQAKTVIYYSNSFKLLDRIQSEDRAHRIGQVNPVHYIDICAQHSVDMRIIEALRAKYDIASQVTGDVLREWI